MNGTGNSRGLAADPPAIIKTVALACAANNPGLLLNEVYLDSRKCFQQKATAAAGRLYALFQGGGCERIEATAPQAQTCTEIYTGKQKERAAAIGPVFSVKENKQDIMHTTHKDTHANLHRNIHRKAKRTCSSDRSSVLAIKKQKRCKANTRMYCTVACIIVSRQKNACRAARAARNAACWKIRSKNTHSCNRRSLIAHARHICVYKTRYSPV
jgi:hypothetical protein